MNTNLQICKYSHICVIRIDLHYLYYFYSIFHFKLLGNQKPPINGGLISDLAIKDESI